MDHAANAAETPKEAEECRTIAGMMTDDDTRGQYLRLAETYELLASNEEKIASNMHNIKK